MSHQQIHTKVHQTLDLIIEGRAFMRRGMVEDATPFPLNEMKACNYTSLKEIWAALLHAEHYVLTEEVINLIDSKAGLASLNALHDCGIHRMPFPEILMEQQLSFDKTVHQFVILVERPPEIASIYPTVGLICYSHGGKLVEIPPFICKMKIAPAPENTEGARWATDMEITQAPWIEGDPGKAFHDLGQYDFMAEAIARAWHDALLLLHTKGIGKEVISAPHKLNKSRGKGGKAPIPTHTVIRIGKVYDRSGNEVARTGPTGRHMRVHWRAGHARNQAWGPGLKDHRLIYIEPVLVNYDPGTGVKPKNIPHYVKAVRPEREAELKKNLAQILKRSEEEDHD